MPDSDETRLYFYPRGEVATDSGDGLTFDLFGFDGQTLVVDPTNGVLPVVYIDGVAQSAGVGYTFNAGSQSVISSITFDASQTGNDISCDYKWKYICDFAEDFTSYAVEKTPNSNAMIDVNGRNMVVEPYQRVTAWRMMVEWKYIDETFYNLIRVAAEGEYHTIDIERVSLSDPFDRINDLYILNFPAFGTIPGVPGRSHTSIETVQIES